MKLLIARLVLACVVGLGSAELFLQLASGVARTLASRVDRSGTVSDEALTILCVGDSHTYGLPLPREESYPEQLEAELSARYPERAFEVVNLGIPGMNSGYAANRLERQMLQLAPELVVVWVGINNQWNPAEAGDAGAPSSPTRLRRLLLHSRLFRLASIAWYTRTGYQYDPDQYGGWYEGERVPTGPRKPGADAGPPAPGLASDLMRMATAAQTLDTPILFVTYPMKKQRPVNRVIEQVAFEREVPLVDGNLVFERAVAEGYEIRALIDRTAGPHPTGLLYGLLLRDMVPRVEDALGLVPE